VAIRVLVTADLPKAAAILADGMRDNPLHVQAFGAQPQRRQRRLHRFLGHLVAYIHARGKLLGAFVDGNLVGVLGMLEPGRCRPRWRDALGFACVLAVSNPPSGLWRIRRWLAVWQRNDAPQPHWHLGPLVVVPACRRRGVGRRLMLRCCRQLDVLAATAWLETDLAINVAFYRTLGFVVSQHEPVLGVPNWFMRRAPGECGSVHRGLGLDTELGTSGDVNPAS
jgi:ribosomal protein S18 acetylase RimI-like enzyme